MTKSLPTDPMTDPASGGAMIGELIPSERLRLERHRGGQSRESGLKRRFYFAASRAHFDRVVKKGFAGAGGSTSPVSEALNVTMCP